MTDTALEQPGGGQVKPCRSCGLSLPLSAFCRRSDARNGLQAYCKECARLSNRATRLGQQKPGWRMRKADPGTRHGPGPGLTPGHLSRPGYDGALVEEPADV